MDGTFIQAGGIVFREGLEAMLVLMALAAYLVKAGQPAKQQVLVWGAGAGVAASLGLAWVFHVFYSGAHSDIIEGVVMTAAAVMMLYVSGWMFVRQDPEVWKATLKRQVDAVVDNGSLWALGAIAFLAVLREGAETVLMLGALATDGHIADMAAGALAAGVVLAVVFMAMKYFAVRIPLRPLFVATSAFLFVLGLHMVLEAVPEFQEAGWLPFTPLSDDATLTMESVGLVLLMAVAALGGTWFARWRELRVG